MRSAQRASSILSCSECGSKNLLFAGIEYDPRDDNNITAIQWYCADCEAETIEVTQNPFAGLYEEALGGGGGSDSPYAEPDYTDQSWYINWKNPNPRKQREPRTPRERNEGWDRARAYCYTWQRATDPYRPMIDMKVYRLMYRSGRGGSIPFGETTAQHRARVAKIHVFDKRIKESLKLSEPIDPRREMWVCHWLYRYYLGQRSNIHGYGGALNNSARDAYFKHCERVGVHPDRARAYVEALRRGKLFTYERRVMDAESRRGELSCECPKCGGGVTALPNEKLHASGRDFAIWERWMRCKVCGLEYRYDRVWSE